jgi:hypothetical protein
MKRILFFTLVATMLLVPCAVAYAHDNVQASEIATTIEPADPDIAPEINVYGNTIGGVTAGDLFLIDLTTNTLDTAFTLCITNSDDLVHNYRYMTLNVGIYVQTNTGEWGKMEASAGKIDPDIYITIQTGVAQFILPGGANYKVTIEKGCYSCYSIIPGKTASKPIFFLATS